MLLPFVADGMPLMYNVVDVITTFLFLVLLADVICHWWLMEMPQVCDVADVITTCSLLY